MFNLNKKSQKEYVKPTEKMLQDDSYEREHSINTVTPTYQGRLDNDRREVEEKIQESRISEAYKENDRIVVEKSFNLSKKQWPHRSVNTDQKQVSDIHAISEAYDQKYRDAFKKENKEKHSLGIFDDYVGDQMIGKRTKIIQNHPGSNSQLQNRPDRFENLDALPHNLDQLKNWENINTEQKIIPMTGYDSIHEKLKTADAMIFSLYTQAFKDNREINKKEQEQINHINNIKKYIIAQSQENNEQLNNQSLEENLDESSIAKDLGIAEIDDKGDIESRYPDYNPDYDINIIEDDVDNVPEDEELFDNSFEAPKTKQYDTPW